MNKFKVFIVLPAYNEAPALAQLLPAIKAQMDAYGPYQIVLADDCSTDATASKIAEWQRLYGLAHVRHDVNKGCGAAVRSGLLWAIPRAQPDDVILGLDADNTHLPKYFPPMIDKIKEGYDVVTASYIMPGGQAFGLTFKRRFLSACVNRMFRTFFPIAGTHLYTNGFRAYNAGVLKILYERYGDRFIEENGFPGGTELFLKARALGKLKTAEVPFTLHYENRGRDSKINIGQTIRGYLRLIKKFLISKKS